ncbi:OmpA family protein [Marnyiella aurantia]|uniref:OmpA family protein n=1 Tax=Marnyiella aurantia TaxID=2758037 RepID=A0A7D7LR13_9FLAO|nr:OmpA family protein [Marnyiella aurantia]MBA5247585.1 OmpA family protein [Marnyiella aurantia]QMS99336.1 OmpA family protein [Marnyiella aurantia]
MKVTTAVLALSLALPFAASAQDSIAVMSNEYPNTYSSGSANVYPFTQDSKRFNDWAISAGVGVPLVQTAELNSIKFTENGGKTVFGYSAYLSIDKAITHAFGLKLQYDRGETRQGWFNTKNADATAAAPIGGRTQYDALSLLGDINLSNLLRRVDNKSPYRWALHAYAGIGTLGFRNYIEDENGQRLTGEVDPLTLGSFMFQGGTGLKYRLNNRLDAEARLMYIYTGDDEFDGIVQPSDKSDNFFNATLGLTYNIGKHQSHLFWHDPLQEIYYKLDVLAEKNQDIEVCKAGDNDNDGVCDDWDRQLDTPAGARVDGAGVALDTDLDGVIDLYDKCVTVPGPVENDGCPTSGPMNGGVVTDDTRTLEGIEFDLNSDRILPSNTPILNNAINYINSTPGAYRVVGGTDTRASDAYNQNLSQRRANTVKNYLVQKGVSSGKLEAVGRGEKDLKYAECDPATKCPEWKNRANRRVYFEAK